MSQRLLTPCFLIDLVYFFKLKEKIILSLLKDLKRLRVWTIYLLINFRNYSLICLEDYFLEKYVFGILEIFFRFLERFRNRNFILGFVILKLLV